MSDDSILGVGCGTLLPAIFLKLAAPGSSIVGLDLDPEVLAIAKRKVEAAGVATEWQWDCTWSTQLCRL